MRKYINLVITVLALVVIDQLTKYLALSYIGFGNSISVTSFFNLTLVYNTGGAFGFLSQSGETLRTLVFVAAVVIIVAVLVAFYAQYHKKSRWSAFFIAMIIGGAIGNLIDRVRLGKVVDFLDIYISRYHWPAFNFADICVTLGIILFILFVLFEGAGCKKRADA